VRDGGCARMAAIAKLGYFAGGAALAGAYSMYMLHDDVWKSHQLCVQSHALLPPCPAAAGVIALSLPGGRGRGGEGGSLALTASPLCAVSKIASKSWTRGCGRGTRHSSGRSRA
jgi:hypothetical protein